MSWIRSNWTRAAFWAAFVIVLALGVRLAVVNQWDGGWDSTSNLVTTRNVAHGRGFTTDMVQDLVAPAPLPGPETVRTPGPVYLLAAVFKLAGESLGAQVLVNLATVLASALLLRWAVRRIAPPWLADFAGVLMLLANSNYRLIPFSNNDLLVLFTVCALCLAVKQWTGEWRPGTLALVAGVLTGVSFLTKQSYVLSMVPFTTLLVASDNRIRFGRRFGLLCVAGALVLLITAVYWGPNMARHGTPIYSPIQQLRLPLRYGTIPFVGYQRIPRFDVPAPTYGSMIASLGLHEVLRHELEVWRSLAPAAAERGFLVLLWAVTSLVFVTRRRLRLYALAATLLVAPIFDSVWWFPEGRYLYPVFPVAIFIAVLGTVGYLEVESSELTPRGRARIRATFTALVLLISGAALLDARWGWRSEFKGARTPAPGWTAAVRRLPENAVVLTAWTPYVAWWGHRLAVMEPWGTRADLEQVVRLYHPTAYLAVEIEDTASRAPFTPGELQLVEQGPDWRLYNIVRPDAAASRPR
ncbi:MAG TPA: glycosyltransferase family 39 protein [Gemmatimonadaceae bacterium]